MLEKIRQYAKKWHMLETKDCVIVGVSGGADSICLVLMLQELQREIGFQMVAVHVNHGLRGEAAIHDETFVKRFCEERGIVCESYFANVELIAKNRKQSTEEAGREVRKAFFEETLQKYNGTKIALAHHQNDSVETFFMNLARGTGLKGLGGISPVNDNVIRPLLCVKRNEIEEYLKEQGIDYCTDLTNASDEYTRNRIRNHILPYMEQAINPKTVEHMNETMEQVRQVQLFLDEQIAVAKKRCVKSSLEGQVILEAEYTALSEALKPLLLKEVLADVAGQEKDLEAIHVKQLAELFGKQTGRKVDLPYQVEAKRVYQGVKLSVKKDDEQRCFTEELFCLQEKNANFRVNGYHICCEVLEKDQILEDDVKNSGTGLFDCAIMRNNLSFRTRRAGDYITIHADGRTQKLKSYFINEKIPEEERDKILLVADGSHVLWIVGYRKNCMYQMKEHTKDVLKIQIDEREI